MMGDHAGLYKSSFECVASTCRGEGVRRPYDASVRQWDVGWDVGWDVEWDVECVHSVSEYQTV